MNKFIRNSTTQHSQWFDWSSSFSFWKRIITGEVFFRSARFSTFLCIPWTYYKSSRLLHPFAFTATVFAPSSPMLFQLILCLLVSKVELVCAISNFNSATTKQNYSSTELTCSLHRSRGTFFFCLLLHLLYFRRIFSNVLNSACASHRLWAVSPLMDGANELINHVDCLFCFVFALFWHSKERVACLLHYWSGTKTSSSEQ